MESDRDSLMMESGAIAPGSSESAALEAGGPVKPGAGAAAPQALIERIFAQCPIVKGGECGAAANQLLLKRLLAMAQRYRKQGNLRQATELYWTLAEDYPGAPEADAAKAVLLELAASYEREGARHMARSMYERLL